jgi:hypothetical protein
LQAHLDTGCGFADNDGRLLEEAVSADDDIAIRLLLRGGCGILAGDGLSVIRAAKLGRGRALQLFRTLPDWKDLSPRAIDAAFGAATEGRRVECMDILLSTHSVSPSLLVFALRHMVSVGSLTGSDVMGDYLLGQLTQLERFKSTTPEIRGNEAREARVPTRADVGRGEMPGSQRA